MDPNLLQSCLGLGLLNLVSGWLRPQACAQAQAHAASESQPGSSGSEPLQDSVKIMVRVTPEPEFEEPGPTQRLRPLLGVMQGRHDAILEQAVWACQ